MIGSHVTCEQTVFDGGIDDPRTRIYLYQQRVRVELLAKAAAAAEHTAWWRTLRSLLTPWRHRPTAEDVAPPARRHSFSAYRQPHHPLGLVTLQGRILGAVADGMVRSGTLFEIASQLTTGTALLREALRALRDGGWIAVQLLPTEQLVIRLERRVQAGPLLGPNRRVHADAWAL